MKRYFNSCNFIKSIPKKEEKYQEIYLVPINSIRYLFYRKKTGYTYSVKILKNAQILFIQREEEMISFFKNFVKDNEFVDWLSVKNLFDGIEFRWYEPYWNCSDELKNLINKFNAWEWYSNIEEPSGFVWSSFKMFYFLKEEVQEEEHQSKCLLI
jgi:hypothetical protein